MHKNNQQPQQQCQRKSTWRLQIRVDTKYGQLDLPRELQKNLTPQLDLPIYPKKNQVLEGFSMVPPEHWAICWSPGAVPLAVPSGGCGGCEPHHIRLGLEAKRLGAGVAWTDQFPYPRRIRKKRSQDGSQNPKMVTSKIAGLWMFIPKKYGTNRFRPIRSPVDQFLRSWQCPSAWRIYNLPLGEPGGYQKHAGHLGQTGQITPMKHLSWIKNMGMLTSLLD